MPMRRGCALSRRRAARPRRQELGSQRLMAPSAFQLELCRGCVGVGAESQVVRRRCRSRARSDALTHVDALVTPGEACRFECMMCAHTNSLCVSDFSFYVYIHMPSQKAFRTDHIDLTMAREARWEKRRIFSQCAGLSLVQEGRTGQLGSVDGERVPALTGRAGSQALAHGIDSRHVRRRWRCRVRRVEAWRWRRRCVPPPSASVASSALDHSFIGDAWRESSGGHGAAPCAL